MCSGMENPTIDTSRVAVTRTSQNLGRTNVFWNGEPPSDTRRVTVQRQEDHLICKIVLHTSKLDIKCDNRHLFMSLLFLFLVVRSIRLIRFSTCQ
jgi:hypothetical protein